MKSFSLSKNMKKIIKITSGVLMTLILAFVVFKPLFIKGENEVEYSIQVAVLEPDAFSGYDYGVDFRTTYRSNIKTITFMTNQEEAYEPGEGTVPLGDLTHYNKYDADNDETYDYYKLYGYLVPDETDTGKYNMILYTESSKIYYYSLESTFKDFASLISIDLSSLEPLEETTFDSDTNASTETLYDVYEYASYESLFENCTSLTSVNVSGLTRTTNNVKKMFYGTGALSSIPNLTMINPYIEDTDSNGKLNSTDYNEFLEDIATGSNISFKNIIGGTTIMDGATTNFSNLLRVKVFSDSSNDCSDSNNCSRLNELAGIKANINTFDGEEHTMWNTDEASTDFSYEISDDDISKTYAVKTDATLSNDYDTSTLTVKIKDDDYKTVIATTTEYSNASTFTNKKSYTNHLLRRTEKIVVPNDYNDYNNQNQINSYISNMVKQATISYGDDDLDGNRWTTLGYEINVDSMNYNDGSTTGTPYIYIDNYQKVKVLNSSSEDISLNFKTSDMINTIYSKETGNKVTFTFKDSTLVAVPTNSICLDVTYNGTEQIIVDETKLAEGYTLDKTTGTYGEVEIAATLETGYIWSNNGDNSTGTVTVTCSIAKAKAKVPTCTGTNQDATGNSVIMYENQDEEYVTLEDGSDTKTQKDINLSGYKYTFKYDTDRYNGFEDTTDSKWNSDTNTLTCPLDYDSDHIIDKPVAATGLEYTGEELDLFPEATDGFTWTSQSPAIAKDATTYSWTAKLNTGYRWVVEDNNTEEALADAVITGTISKQKVSLPTCNNITASNKDEDNYYTYLNTDSRYTISDNGKSLDTEATFTLTLNDTNNYIWSLTDTDSIFDQQVSCALSTLTVEKPELEDESYVYSNTMKSYIDSAYFGFSGYTITLKYNGETAVAENPIGNVGEYVYTFTLNSGYKWTDGTTDPFNVTITITKMEIDKPEAFVGLVYNTESENAQQVATIEQSYSYWKYVEEDGYETEPYQTNAGTYKYKAELKDKDNTKFKDTDDTTIEFTATIARCELTQNIPYIPYERITYDENEHELVANLNSDYWELYEMYYDEGRGKFISTGYDLNSQTNPGEYTVAIKLNDFANTYIQGHENEEIIEYTVIIDKAVATAPTITSQSYDYTGEKITFVEQTEDSKWILIDPVDCEIETGNTYCTYDNDNVSIIDGYAINAGTYEFKIAPKFGYIFDGNYTDTYTFTINARKVSYPTAITGLTYTGESQKLYNYDENYVEILDGEVEGTNAGNYSIIFKLKDTINMLWTDSESGHYNLVNSIAKAKVDVPTCKENVIYDEDDDEKEYTLINDYNATAITLYSDNGGVNETSSSKTWEDTSNTGTFKFYAKVTNSNYEWNLTDATEIQEVGTCQIKVGFKTAHMPTISETYEYNGKFQQLLTLPTEDDGYELYDGEEKITDETELQEAYPKTYTYTAKLLAGYVWDDEEGSSDDITLTRIITKATLENTLTEITNLDRSLNTTDLVKEYLDENNKFNTGLMNDYFRKLGYTFVITSYNVEFNDTSTETSYTDGGTLTVTGFKVMLNEVDVSAYFSSTPQNVTTTFSYGDSFTKTKVTIPNNESMCIKNVTYTGEELTLLNELDDDSKYTITLSGTKKTINAGNYTYIASLKDTSLYEWEDGTTTNKEFVCTINTVQVDKPLIEDGLSYATAATAYIKATDYYSPSIYGYRTANEYDKDENDNFIAERYVYILLTPKSNYSFKAEENAQEITRNSDGIEGEIAEFGESFFDNIPDGAILLRQEFSLKRLNVILKDQTILVGKYLHSGASYVESATGLCSGHNVTSVELSTDTWNVDPGEYTNGEERDYVQSFIVTDADGNDTTEFYDIQYNDFKIIVTDDEENENLSDYILNKSDVTSDNICRYNSGKLDEKGVLFTGSIIKLVESNSNYQFENEWKRFAGDYEVQVTPGTSYTWEDGSVDPITVTCSIIKLDVTITANDQEIYEGKEISKTIEDVTVTGITLNQYHDLTSITLTRDGNSIIPSNAIFKNVEDEDHEINISDSFNITYVNGTVTTKEATGLIEMDNDDVKVSNQLITLPDVATLEEFKAFVLKEYGDKTTFIHLDKDKNTKEDENLATTDYVEIDGTDYQVVVKGDIDCDGKISSSDTVKLIKHIMAEDTDDTKIKDELLLSAANYDNNETVGSSDLVGIIKYIMSK